MKCSIFSICILFISIIWVSCNNNEYDATKKIKIIDAPKKYDSTEREKMQAEEAQIFKRFKTLSFDSVVMQDHDGMNKKFKSKKVVLSAEYRDTLKQIILNDSIRRKGFSNCFIPRQSIYLFNKKDTVGVISVCLQCSKAYYENKILKEETTINYIDYSHTLQAYCRLCKFYKLRYCII